MNSSGPTVYIVDDDQSVRESLALLLSLKGYPTKGFESAEAFLAAASQDWAGCVLADLRMPGMSGLELQSALQENGIELPVIFVTAHADIGAARQALKSGAVDFIEKPIDDDELIGAIRAAWERDATRRRRSADRDEFQRLLMRLTPREREILDLLVIGRHNREIAEQLSISPRTVEVHKARIMEKLRMQRMPEIIRAMLLHGGPYQAPS